jgi:hypothetical protein
MVRFPWVTATLVSIWFVVMALLGAAGAFVVAPGGYPLALLAALLVPVAVYLIDRRLGLGLWRGVAGLPLHTLAVLQTWRIGGVLFLVEWGRGHLPGGFALPAGIGDVLIGLTAPLIAAAVSDGRSGRRLFLFWNAAGLFDLVLAVSAGVTHSRGPLGILTGALAADRVAQYPLSLIPTFLVPLAIIVHLTGFLALRHQELAPAAGALTPARPIPV